MVKEVFTSSPAETEASNFTLSEEKEQHLFDLDVQDEDSETASSESQYYSKIRKARIYMLFTKQDIPLLFFGGLSTIFGALGPAISSILMGRVFDVLSNFTKGKYNGFGEYMQAIRMSSMSIILLGVGCIPLVWITITCWMQFGERQGLRARTNILKTFMVNPISWYDENETLMGDLTQINRCVEELRAGTSEATALVLQNFVSLAALIGTALYYSWSVTLVMLASSPIIVIFAYIFAKLTEKYTNNENVETAKAAKTLDWSLFSAKLVRLFSTQDQEYSKFTTAVKNCKQAFFKLTLVTSANMALLRFIMLCMYVQGFWFGSTQVRKGKVDPGDVITCFTSCLMLAETLKSTLPQIITIQKAKVAIAKIQNFIQMRKTKTMVSKFKQQIDLDDTRNISLYPDVCHGDIKFKNVDFSYPTRFETKVLKDVSIHFPAGETTFLVGRSGSGKSTLSSLLLNFYRPNKGRVEIDGFSVSKLNSRWLTDNITLVEQTCTLFKDTIKNNILMGKIASENQEVSDEELQNACQMALLHEVIRDLDDGLDTIVGPNGITLSGGQQQRVALARARVRDTPILILDESVSALDIVLRELIIAAVKKWRKGKTTIILTHEFSQIGKDDYVYLMEDGIVAENGLRKDLENQNGLFKRLANLQDTTVEKLNDVEQFKGFKKQLDLHEPLHDKIGSRLSSQIISSINPLSFFGQSSEAQPPSDRHDFTERKVERRRRKIQKPATSPISEGQDQKDLEANEEEVEDEEKDKKDERPDLTPILTIIKKMYQTVDRKPLLFAGILFSILNGAVNPIFSYTFSKLLSGIVPQDKDVGSSSYLLKWSLVVIFLALFDGISTFLKEFLLHYSSEIWIYSLRRRAFSTISQQSISWFGEKTNSPAEVSALLLNDSRDLRSLVSQFLGIVSTASILSSLGLIWALVSGWKLSLVCFALIPAFVLTSGIYATLLQTSENEYKNAIAELENQIYESVRGIRTIKVLRLEKYFTAKFNERAENLKRVARRRAIYTGFGVSLTTVLTFVVQGVLLYYGMRLVGLGEYSTTKLMQTFVLLLFSIMSCVQLINQIPDISRGQRAATYIFRILDLEPSETETMGSVIPYDDSKNVVEFDHLDFAYPSLPDNKVLKNMTFNIKKGEHVSVIGESGSGKSTLTLLLTRLFQVPKGTVSFEGVDINDLDVTWLRDVVSLVDQKAVFFDGTIRENLSYGSEDVKEDTLIESLKLANIYDFVISLPEGIDSRIDTSLISGGQAQRLSIARALVRKPKLLILDECTSALDSESAKNIANLVKENLKNQKDLSVLIITHSEEMMKVSDRVLTLKNGKICEEGPFDELFYRRGELFRIVTAGFQS
ncbi:Multidrug resistance protein [Wickerhamomyces ciferrii]|uniref:Multidrug resistance protein n=1 Tax=Wickerhamomyces ciferrii (strain ATCC 14091 / BCRC 22168 / CBS 111 / JCM 3599 / NBRC 0793 / NRRL Y-1031 F-60-10) TaxID=1206466 RepID=K0KDK9_WICCF|nr:Multidrug resistance protein [Wickerhamomyces ciferrii]CCH41011.1 Multidrug resistance protein [Wickerhamomyces ciferrii]